MSRICIVLGTRPEAIKLALVIKSFKDAIASSSSSRAELRVLVTAQHRGMMDQVLDLFQIRPQYDLDIMTPGQDLTDITSRVLVGLREVFHQWRPDLVLVQGDTTTALGASLAAFYEKVPVGHVEAGLRTGNILSPWPEEMNRRLISTISSLHFAPTESARQNLLREGISPNSIYVTGNTVIDALLYTVESIRCSSDKEAELIKRFSFLDSRRQLILVTGHRRENFGDGFERVCGALMQLAGRPDAEIVYPVHLNPNVQEPVRRILGNHPNIHLIEPLDYLPFVYLLNRAHLIITDSGGIQEEAPSFGKPVLVTRDATERPEAVIAGTAKLVGTVPEAIVAEAVRLLTDPAAYSAMSRAHNPFGDGAASSRIVDVCLKMLDGDAAPQSRIRSDVGRAT